MVRVRVYCSGVRQEFERQSWQDSGGESLDGIAPTAGDMRRAEFKMNPPLFRASFDKNYESVAGD